MKYICFFLALFIISCGRRKELPPPSYINEIIAIDTTKIRFDGFYNTVNPTYKSEGFVSIYPIILTKNQKIFQDSGASKTDDIFTCEWYKKTKKEKIGYFSMNGDVIYAYLPTRIIVWGMRHQTYFAHFKGIVRNKDTIIDWKMVAPYPKAMKNFEFELIDNQWLFTPQTMHFVATDAVKCLNTD